MQSYLNQKNLLKMSERCVPLEFSVLPQEITMCLCFFFVVIVNARQLLLPMWIGRFVLPNFQAINPTGNLVSVILFFFGCLHALVLFLSVQSLHFPPFYLSFSFLLGVQIFYISKYKLLICFNKGIQVKKHWCAYCLTKNL